MPKGIKVLVVSNRQMKNKVAVFRELTLIHKQSPIAVVYIDGNDRGTDFHAYSWCKRNKVPYVIYDKSQEEPQIHDRAIRKYRFLQMLQKNKPDLVVIWPKSSDCHDIIKTTMLLGFPIKVINELVWERNRL